MRPTLSCLAPLLLLLTACGGPDEVWAGDDSRLPGGLVRLELEGTNPDYDPGEVQSYLSFQVPRGELPTGWKMPPAVTERAHEERPALGGTWDGIRFLRKGALTLPGPMDPRGFNRAVVRLALSAKADLYVELRREGKLLTRSQNVRVAGVLTPQTVIIDLPRNLHLEDLATELRLGVIPLGGKPAILGVELVRTPIAEWLPSVEEGLAPVTLQGEARHALALSSRNPLEAEISAPPGAFLAFAYSRPERIFRRGETLEILVDVRGEAGRPIASERLRLSKGKNLLTWQEARIPLDHYGGEPLTLRFSLEGGSPEHESLVALASPRLERELDHPPAVLLVTSDTHRADHLGGGGKVSTPFLDRLAQEGILFEDCYAAINITNPSHAAILTGLPARDTGLVDNITALADEALTLAECFQQAGYYTIASLSAKHMNHDQSGLGQGFDQIVWPTRGGAIDSPQAIEPLNDWLNESTSRPVFAWLHVFDAHAPYDVPESHRWLYYDEQRDPYDPDLPRLRGKAQPSWDPELRDMAFAVAQYRSEVTYLDQQLAGALAHPRLADALIAVTADHGEHFGSHGLFWTHQGLYPETLAVPLILSWPGGPAGVRVKTPIDQLDLGRTLLDLGGVTWTDFPGRNLMRHVEQPDAPGAARFAIGSHGSTASISHEGWFLVLSLHEHFSPPREEHQVELYLPADDPECAHDLIDEEFEQARRLRARLIAWLEAAPATRLARQAGVSDPQVLAELAALGYAQSGAEERPEQAAWFVADPQDNDWDRRFEDG